MKYLFVVQGEGRGHLTQALTLEERLRAEGHEVVEVLVGKSRTRELPAFFRERLKAPLRRFESPNFLPTPANRENLLLRSIFYNLTRLRAFVRSIAFINRRIRETDADVVVNFYELLTGLTYLFCRPGVRQVCIGHQYLFLHRDFRFPKAGRMSLALLRFFTRMTAIGADRLLALSFHRMDNDGRIRPCPPLLRREVLELKATEGDYVHGYMVNAGFAEQVMEWHKAHPEVSLRFFWDRRDKAAGVWNVDDTLSFHPLNDIAFLKQMSGCRAYASTAGFESVCEAMYLGKPVLMVPAHIEQECNAYDAMQQGAGIVAHDFRLDELLDFCATFRQNRVFAAWAERTDILIDLLTEEHHTFVPRAVGYDWSWLKMSLASLKASF